MKLKVLLSTLIFVLLTTFTLFQTQSPVSAISPVTSPVTSAMIQVSGVVRYLSLTVYRFLPVNGADVTARNNKTGDVFMATTNANGEYNLSVPAGKYMLVASASALPNYKFVPNFNNLPLLFNFPGLDFFGLPKH